MIDETTFLKNAIQNLEYHIRVLEQRIKEINNEKVKKPEVSFAIAGE